MSTIRLFHSGDDIESLELFAPKRVSEITSLQLFPHAFGLRTRGAESKQGEGPTYVKEDSVPSGDYVVSVRVPDKSVLEVSRKFSLKHLDNFKLKKQDDPLVHNDEEEAEGEDEEELSHATTVQDRKRLKHESPMVTAFKDPTIISPSSLPRLSFLTNSENVCEFCPTIIEGRRVICGSKVCQVAYARSRARVYRAQKRRAKGGDTGDSEKSGFQPYSDSEGGQLDVLRVELQDKEKEKEGQTDDEATDDEAQTPSKPSHKIGLSHVPLNPTSSFWKLVPEYLRITPTPIPWDKLGVGHPNPEKGVWYRAAYVYGAHMPNQWHERTMVAKLLDRDTSDDKRVMRSVFLPRNNNLKGTPYFPALDRSLEPASNTLLMMKGDGRGQCGYMFMVWNPTMSYGCPMTLLLSRPCPFAETCPVTVKSRE